MMTVGSLSTITDHPKIAVSSEEYARIQSNLAYFESKFDDVKYTNSDGTVKERKLMHLPLARTACKKIASLIYNESATIQVDDAVADEFVQGVLLNDRFNKNFERYLESCLALGGMAMRPYVDGDKVKVAFIQAPVFLPLETNTQDVSSAAIVTKTIKAEGNSNKYYTLIEFHEWDSDRYVITNELYRSDMSSQVGVRVPLSEIYEDLEEEVTLNNLSRPLFTYLKTAGMNNKDINSPLGLSIFDNAKTTIDFINKTYDEFAWEVKMGQRRVVVPMQTVKVNYRSDGSKMMVDKFFDPEQNVYMQIDSGDVDKQVGIVDLTTPIRSESYIAAINKGLSLFEMQIGVSAGMFSFDGKSMKTATEVVSENSDTYQMRNSLASLVEYSIKELVVSICELAKAYGLYNGVIPELQSITVNLDDGVFTDRNDLLEYWTKAAAAGFCTKEYGIQKALGLSEEEARKMVEDINGETISDTMNVRSKEDVKIYGE